MRKERLYKFKDMATAEVLSLGSIALDFMPVAWSQPFIPPAPSGRRIAWRSAHTALATVQTSSIEQVGDPKAGSTPSQYRLAQTIKIDRESLDNFQARHMLDTPIIAYQLGTVVMYGFSQDPTQSILGLESPNAEDYEAAIGIGPGSLQAWIGAGNSSSRHVINRLWQERGVRAGPVLAMGDVPPYIPTM